MSDAIIIARCGVAAVAVITEPFFAQGALVARSKGMADIPRVRVTYPIAGTGPDNITKVAHAAIGDIARALGWP